MSDPQKTPSAARKWWASDPTPSPTETLKRMLFGGLGGFSALSVIYIALCLCGKLPTRWLTALLFTLLFIAALFAVILLLGFILSRIWPSGMVLKDSKYMEIDSIFFDNPLFRWSRRTVFRLDEAIFNRHYSAGPLYQPTRFVLVLPFWCAILATFGHFVDSLLFCAAGNNPYGKIVFYMPFILFNVFFFCKNCLAFPNRLRQYFYPIFITICSLGFFLLVFALFWWLSSFAWIVLLVCAALTGGGSSSSSSSCSSGGTSSGDEEYVQQATICNGSVIPTTITRTGGMGDWHGDDGHTYTEDMEGNLHRK